MTSAFLLRIAGRVVALVGVLLAVAIVTFALQNAAPGDAAEARVGTRADLSPAQRNVLIVAARQELGLNRPLPVQFGIWLGHAVRFDFGDSDNGDTVSATVGARLQPTIELALASAIISVPLAIGLALLVAGRRKRSLTRLLDVGLTGGLVVPPFWVGILLVLLFAVELHWLPASGYVPFTADPVGHLKTLAMPAVTLAVPQITVYYRYLEESLRGALKSPYAKAARARGINARHVLVGHALPNALLPALTIFGIYLGSLIGGVIVIESVFSWPGLGSLLVYTVERSDYNTLVAIVLATATFYVVISTLVDVLYLYLDPRTRRA
jgi:peptide/nickel transport system permease protein